MSGAFLRRPRNVIILVLVLLGSLHFLLFVAQNYQIEIRPRTPDKSWLESSLTHQEIRQEGEFVFEDLSGEIRKGILDQARLEEDAQRKEETSVVGYRVVDDHKPRREPIQVFPTASEYGQPSPIMIKLMFGNDIIQNDKMEYVQKPFLRRGINPIDGSVELLPRGDGIQKYTKLGNLRDFQCDEEYCYSNDRQIKKELIVETPSDMFTFLPPKSEFMKEFKNPCWKANDLVGEKKLFCMPYFYIIGFTKCGTTDLFAVLKNHTLVSSRAGKETHYIDRSRRGRIIRMNRPPSRDSVSFLSWTNAGKFRAHLLNTYKKVEGSSVMFHGITMDATPSHVWDNEFWELHHPDYREPPVTNADLVASINPEAKVIVSLRNPINRMQSAYQFFCAFHVYPCDTPISPLKFHRLVAEAIRVFEECRGSNTDRGCVYSTRTHQLATHMYASLYSVYLADWLKVLPRDQIHVIMFEEHIEDEIKSIQAICDFLEIPRFSEEYLQQYLDQHQIRNSLSDDYRLPYILPDTMQLLKTFFRPFLDDLVKLLGDEKWYWNIYDEKSIKIN